MNQCRGLNAPAVERSPPLTRSGVLPPTTPLVPQPRCLHALPRQCFLSVPVKSNRSFGNYALTCAAADGVLIFKRSLLLESATIPVDQYPAVRDFFERIRQAEVSPVVLVRE